MKYVALLRKLNVGGSNIVSMKDLKASFEKAGFRNVSTYINSGNVLFDSDESNIETLIGTCERFLEEDFGLPIRLTVISRDGFKEAMEHAPAWWGVDLEAKNDVIFVMPPATAEDIIAEVGAARPEYEKIEAYQNVIFWFAPIQTYSRTRWSKIIGTPAYQKVTMRNANTARKLLALVTS